MNEASPVELLHRITNCLETILELETKIEQLELGEALLREFNLLKRFLARIDTVELQEEDVSRIEDATAHFLEELKIPLALLDGEEPVKRYMQ